MRLLLAIAVTVALSLTGAQADSRTFQKKDERQLYNVYLTKLRAEYCSQQFGLPTAAIVEEFAPALEGRLQDLGDDKRAKIVMAWADEDYNDLSEADCKRVQNAKDALHNYWF